MLAVRRIQMSIKGDRLMFSVPVELVYKQVIPEEDMLPRPLGMTPRQLEVFQLMQSGACTKDIANRLGITPRTIKFHISTIYQKCDVSSRMEFHAKFPVLTIATMDQKQPHIPVLE